MSYHNRLWLRADSGHVCDDLRRLGLRERVVKSLLNSSLELELVYSPILLEKSKKPLPSSILAVSAF